MRFLLQGRVPYQDSLRWQIHRDYFKSRGIDVFLAQEVPYDITSNPRFALQCARVVRSALMGARAPGSVRILELGAGLGCFALHFLTALTREAQQQGDPWQADWEYWITDLSPATVRSWQKQSAFAPWLASGHLKTACFDSLLPERMTAADGSVLPFPSQGWDVILANYHFCVLPVALLLCQAGTFYQVESELFCWLAGSPQQPPTLSQRQQVLAQLADQLRAWDAAGIADVGLAEALRRVIPEIAQTMASPVVARNWQAAMELRSSLVRWLLEAWQALPGIHTQAELQQLQRSLPQALDLPAFRTDHVHQQQLQDVYTPCAVKLEQFTADVCLRQVLGEFSQRLGQAVLTVPQAGLALLTQLRARLKPGGIMLLSDKGLYALEQMQGLAWSVPSYHAGSLAQMVNFPLLERWLAAQGCATRLTQDPAALIQTLLVGAGPALSDPLEESFDQEFIYSNRNMEQMLWLQAGSEFYRHRKLEDALRYYQAALRLDPQDETTLLFMASAFLALNRPEQARTCLEQIPEPLLPHPARMQLQAELWKKLNQPERAASLLAQLQQAWSF